MKIEELWIYPIKSCAGHTVETAELQLTGLQHDRSWMVVTPEGHFITQRQCPQMALLKPKVSATHLRLSFPGIEPLSAPVQPEGEPMTVTVWKDRVEAQSVSTEAEQWISAALQRSCRLVKMQHAEARMRTKSGLERPFAASFADSAPVLLTNRSSLRAMSARAGGDVEMTRFRPNIVVDSGSPFCEEAWVTIRSQQAFFDFAYPCERCTVINRNQLTAAEDTSVMRTLLAERKQRGLDLRAIFGIRLVPEACGTLRITEDLAFT